MTYVIYYIGNHVMAVEGYKLTPLSELLYLYLSPILFIQVLIL